MSDMMDRRHFSNVLHKLSYEDLNYFVELVIEEYVALAEASTRRVTLDEYRMAQAMINVEHRFNNGRYELK